MNLRNGAKITCDCTECTVPVLVSIATAYFYLKK